MFKTTDMFFEAIATCLANMFYFDKQNNHDSLDKWDDIMESLCKEHLPSGSGFDSGCELLFNECKIDRIVIQCDYHHMNEHGYYEGWSEHKIIIKPDFRFRYTTRITGRNVNNIKEYIDNTFHNVLTKEVKYSY